MGDSEDSCLAKKDHHFASGAGGEEEEDVGEEEGAKRDLSSASLPDVC